MTTDKKYNLNEQSPKQLLASHGIKPSKHLGQNFLINQGILEKIIQTADLKATDTIIEIGPGPGILTTRLAPLVKKVIAVEKDHRLVQLLSEILTQKKISNVEIINQDILKLQIADYKLQENYKLIANIPYYLTSPIIRKFLEAHRQPQKMVLLIQKEVVHRICAQPDQMNILAIAVQFYARPKIIAPVSKNSFWPAPKVDSAIIEIVPLDQQSSSTKRDNFFRVVRAGFAAPRKQLLGNLHRNLKIDRNEVEKILLSVGLNPKQRAETLSVDNWKRLTHRIIVLDPAKAGPEQ